MSYSQRNVNQTLANLGMKQVRTNIPKCKNCGEEINSGYYGCKKCGYYDKEREEYDKKVANEKQEIDKINTEYLNDFLTGKGFQGIKGYDIFLENEAKKHKQIVWGIRLIIMGVGLILLFNGQIFNGIIIGIIGWFLGSLYKWIKFGDANKMDDFNLVYKQNKKTTVGLISNYTSMRKKMDETIENELYF